MSKTSPPLILLLDDDPLILRAYARELEQAGFAVVLALSVDSAKAWLASVGERVKVAYVDWLLAEGTSKDFIHWLREEHPRVWVFVLTAAPELVSGLPSDVLVLPKPLQVEAFVEVAASKLMVD